MRFDPRIALCAFVIFFLAASAHGQIYTSDPNIADFTGQIASYATLSNFNNSDGCVQTSTFVPTASELAGTPCRVYSYAPYTNVPGLTVGQNWVLATFYKSDNVTPLPVSTIVVFPSIDHFGAAYDGYQYSIYGSNDGANWTFLFDALTVPGEGEPFELGTFNGTAPTVVNNVLASNPGVGGTVGYIAYFNFGAAYAYYAFGTSTVAGPANPEQELSAVGTPVMRGPTSGAMLSINGTVNGTPVSRNIYDSQIHTGTVRTVTAGTWPQCDSNDVLFPTDAYVLEGGSWRGCMPTFTPVNGSATLSGTGYSFGITTQYTGGCDTTANNICAPNGGATGLLTVKNNSGFDFTGTIALLGTSNSIGGANCPASGIASDSVSGLADGASVILALSPGSNNCAGFNFDQVSKPMTSSTQVTTFLFGADKFAVTPSNIASNDILTFRPVPMPTGQFNLPGLTLTASPFGNGQQCISIADFAAAGNPVCPEFQTHCFKADLTTACTDAETFFWTGEFDARLDPNAGYPLVGGVPEIGGVHFLGAPSVNCPQNMFSEDIVLSYTGDSPSDLPLKSGGSGLNCFASTFDATATPIPAGVTASSFFGFEWPVNNAKLNYICPGCILPLSWDSSNGAGGAPLTNLHWCPNGPSSPGVCSNAKVSPPWVYLQQIPIQCADGTANNFFSAGAIVPIPILGYINFGKGEYVFNWLVPVKERGCATVQLQFSNGAVVSPANFEIKPIK